MNYESKWWWLFWVVFAYVAIAGAIYRFDHPEKTETQLMLEFHKALLWQK